MGGPITCNEAETRFHLIDPVLREKGYDDHQRIKLETPAPVDEVVKIEAAVKRSLSDLCLLPQKLLSQAFEGCNGGERHFLSCLFCDLDHDRTEEVFY